MGSARAEGKQGPTEGSSVTTSTPAQTTRMGQRAFPGESGNGSVEAD